MNLLNNFYLYLSRLMGKMYTNISTFLDSRQKIAGMTGDFGVIPEVFCRESIFIPKDHIYNYYISYIAQRIYSGIPGFHSNLSIALT